MPEISITGWLDPAFRYFAEQSGIPIDQYSSQVGGEGIGTALEVVADFFTKGWLNKAVQAVAGLIADGYAIWGKDVPMRLRRELLALGTHELLRIVDPKPSDVIEFRRSLDSFVRAAQRGDWNAALSSVLRTPSEIQAMVGVAPTPVQHSPATTTQKKYVTKTAPTFPLTTTQKKYVTKTAPTFPLALPAPTVFTDHFVRTTPSTPAKGRYTVTG